MKKLNLVSVLVVLSLVMLVGSSASGIIVEPSEVPQIGAMIDGLGGMDLTIDAAEYEREEGGKKWKLKDVQVSTGWGGMGTVEIEELEFDADPIVYNNILVSNNSNVDQNWLFTVVLPTTFGAPNMIRGSIDTSIIGTDALLTAPVGGSVYTALIDGSGIETLQDDPFALGTGQSATSDFQSFGWQASLTPVGASMGIQIAFTLSPGDTAAILSDFEITPEPGTLAMLGLGALALLGVRRRRA